MIPRKKSKKPKTGINTSISLIKEHWIKVADIPQKRNFLTWSIQNFVRKKKQFVRKYYIIWLFDLSNKSYDVEKVLISFYVICY